MSAWRNDIAKRKEKILPAARSDAEWHGAAWSLPWRWEMLDWVGLNVSGVARLGIGASSWDLHDFPLVVLPAKSEK